jgi:hypothetical protein
MAILILPPFRTTVTRTICSYARGSRERQKKKKKTCLRSKRSGNQEGRTIDLVVVTVALTAVSFGTAADGRLPRAPFAECLTLGKVVFAECRSVPSVQRSAKHVLPSA